jgi:hypothetical protein
MEQPSRDEIAAILTKLTANFTRCFVMDPTWVAKLPLLRALEFDGFVAIKSVVLNLNWVVTPAGLIWLTLHERALKNAKTRIHANKLPPVTVLNDLLLTQPFAWMTLAEARTAVVLLLEKEWAVEVTSMTNSWLAPDAGPFIQLGEHVPGTGEPHTYFTEPHPFTPYPSY